MLSARKTPNFNHLLPRILKVAVAMLSGATLQAEVEDIRSALNVAMQHEAIRQHGEKIKLYSLAAHYNGDNKRWNFQFFNSGENLHTITVTDAGKAFHSLRNKGKASIFEDLDFSLLPPPGEVLIDDLVTRGNAAVTALKFKPANNGRLYIRYHLHQDLRHKGKARHSWSVTVPVADGKRGKTITFDNGQVETVTNAILSGS